MITKIDHIGIAVKDIDESIKPFCNGLGLAVTSREKLEKDGLEVAFVPASDVNLEFITSTREGTAIQKFLDSKGNGIHHICLEVADIRAAMQKARDEGLTLIDQEPRRGAHDALIAFIHPKATSGILIELKQKQH